MNFNQYECGGGIAVPVNPIPNSDIKNHPYFPVRDQNKRRNEFQTWLQSQPTIHCSPELSGVYPVGEFGEVVWQFKHPTQKWWMNALPEAYKNCNNNYQEYETLCLDNQFQCRLFIEYTGANHSVSEPEFIKALMQKIVPRFPETVAEVEAYENIIGNPDINFPVEEMTFDHLKSRMDQPTIPEQKGVEQGESNYKGESYYKQYTGEILDIFYRKFYEPYSGNASESDKKEAFYEWLNEQIKLEII